MSVSASPSTAAREERLLIVDDEQGVRELVGTTLEGAGYESLALESGGIATSGGSGEVDWGQIDLLHFMNKNGFQPAPRVCLERRLGV